MPAVGFAIVIDRLMMAMDRQKIPVDTGTQVTAVLYKPEDKKEAIKIACRLRSQGKKAALMAMDGEADREKWQQFALKRGFCSVVTAHSKSGETGSGAAMY